MTRVLVTGGTGTLGRALVPALREAGHSVGIMSRSPPGPSADGDAEWAQADLRTGTGLDEAVHGVDVVVHAATNALDPQTVDVLGTRRLLTAARAAGVEHLVYVSIVGIDDIPLAYYRAKLEAERAVERSGIPHTILRATQFHDLMEQWFLRGLVQGRRIGFLPKAYRFQLIDVRDVAARIAEIVDGPPLERAPDVGGPELLRLGDIARQWREATGRRALLLDLPKPGETAAAYRAGHATTGGNRYGMITWALWLAERYPAGMADSRPARTGSRSRRGARLLRR
jgi:uncharacterized protein YbjT (DUF2867 family)